MPAQEPTQNQSQSQPQPQPSNMTTIPLSEPTTQQPVRSILPFPLLTPPSPHSTRPAHFFPLQSSSNQNIKLLIPPKQQPSEPMTLRGGAHGMNRGIGSGAGEMCCGV